MVTTIKPRGTTSILGNTGSGLYIDPIGQPLLRAVPMGLFPQMNTLQEVIDLGETKLPIHNKNDLVSLIMCYHNTLLKVANDQPK